MCKQEANTLDVNALVNRMSTSHISTGQNYVGSYYVQDKVVVIGAECIGIPCYIFFGLQLSVVVFASCL